MIVKKLFHGLDLQSNKIVNALGNVHFAGTLHLQGAWITTPAAKQGEMWLLPPGLTSLLNGGDIEIRGGDVLLCVRDTPSGATENWVVLRSVGAQRKQEHIEIIATPATSGTIDHKLPRVTGVTAYEINSENEKTPVIINWKVTNNVIFWETSVPFQGEIIVV